MAQPDPLGYDTVRERPLGYDTVRNRLSRILRADQEPTLEDADLDDLLYLAQRVDCDGRTPADTGWLGAWELNSAAAEGWRRKAAALATQYDVQLDGQQIRRSQAYAQCIAQADKYAAQIVASATVGPGAVAGWEMTPDVN